MGDWVSIDDMLAKDRDRELHGMDWRPTRDTGVEERHEIEVEIHETAGGHKYWRALCWCGWKGAYSKNYVRKRTAEREGEWHLRAMEENAKRAPRPEGPGADS